MPSQTSIITLVELTKYLSPNCVNLTLNAVPKINLCKSFGNDTKQSSVIVVNKTTILCTASIICIIGVSFVYGSKLNLELKSNAKCCT